MRILFAGSPGIALPALRVLADLAGQGALELAGVLTNPDSPRGRHGTPEPTEVGAFAEERSLAPVLKPAKLDAGAREAVAALEPDLLLSFAYGRIFGPKFLALFPGGGINIHPSLLPRYRGPTPIQAAILNRDTETGISIQRIAPEMDAGDILAQERIPLSGRETAASLGETVAGKGAAMLAALCAAKLQALAAEGLEGLPQDHSGASYCGLISREMGRIDWTKCAEDIDARIRAYTPWPLCLTRQGAAELYILAGRPLAAPAGDALAGTAAPGTVLGADKDRGILIQTGQGIFAAEKLQYRGRKALDWRAFLNGARNFSGSRLT